MGRGEATPRDMPPGSSEEEEEEESSEEDAEVLLQHTKVPVGTVNSVNQGQGEANFDCSSSSIVFINVF